MARKQYNVEAIILKLREADVLLAQAKDDPTIIGSYL